MQLYDLSPTGADEVDEGVVTITYVTAEKCQAEDVDAATRTPLSSLSFVDLVDILILLQRVY